jgi:hypothetical protein
MSGMRLKNSWFMPLFVLACAAIFVFTVNVGDDTLYSYVNKEYGVSFDEPAGWTKSAGGAGKNYLVIYTDYIRRATIGITLDDISAQPEIKSSLDFAIKISEYVLSNYQDAKMVKHSQLADINGIKAAVIMYDRQAAGDGSKIGTVSTMMIFVKKREEIITINIVAPAEEWEAVMKDADKITNSLKIDGA